MQAMAAVVSFFLLFFLVGQKWSVTEVFYFFFFVYLAVDAVSWGVKTTHIRGLGRKR